MVFRWGKNVCKVLLPVDGEDSVHQGYNRRCLDSVSTDLRLDNFRIQHYLCKLNIKTFKGSNYIIVLNLAEHKCTNFELVLFCFQLKCICLYKELLKNKYH
jgi:hypothetical protein